MGIYRLKGMGWLPGYPDFREYTMENLFKVKGNKLSTNDTKVPQTMDLRKLCSPIKDQGKLASATSHAVAGLIEYYERQRYGNMVAFSRLFLY